jgi:hypothetical protein
MGNDVMTGYLGAGASPLSRITVGTLQDLGYPVDYSKADAFTRNDLNSTCTCPVRRLRQNERSLLDMNHGEIFSVVSNDGTRATGRPRRRLSESAEEMAIEAGLEYLQANANNANDAEVDDLGITYVADEVVSVLIFEDAKFLAWRCANPRRDKGSENLNGENNKLRHKASWFRDSYAIYTQFSVSMRARRCSRSCAGPTILHPNTDHLDG